MIDLHASPEVEGIIAYGQSTGVPMIVTSTIRPGAITGAGNLSYHAVGQAVDWAAPTPTVDSQVLADIFHAFLPLEKHLAELIYAGPQVNFNISNGRRVGKYAQAIHHNHVHVAVQKGVLLDRLIPTFTPDTTVEQAPTHEGEDMADPVDALAAPSGGVWVLTRDGGVRAYKGAPFHGSYPGLPEQDRLATDPFVEIIPRDDGVTDGYMLKNSGGALYRFPV